MRFAIAGVARKGDRVFYSVLVRRLKEGASFEDFRKTWEPEPVHFGGPVRVTHARRIDDEQEILSFSLIDISAEEMSAALQRIAEAEKRRHEQIAEVIDTTGAAGIYEVIAEVDLLTRVSWRDDAQLERALAFR